MSDRNPVETEVKIPVESLLPVRDRLEAQRAEQVHPAERETNILLDNPSGEIATSGRVLRLRCTGDRHRLTLKGPASFDRNIKSREELEIEISDLDTLATIFARIGFHPVLRYEKDRETWRKGDVTVTLDHTPMGDFVEVEGTVKQVRQVAAELGLDLEDAVRSSYPDLWREHRERYPERELPVDMVFPS